MQNLKQARLYLAGCALTGLAQQHTVGTDHSIALGADAAVLADATLKALRIGANGKRARRAKGAR